MPNRESSSDIKISYRASGILKPLSTATSSKTNTRQPALSARQNRMTRVFIETHFDEDVSHTAAGSASQQSVLLRALGTTELPPRQRTWKALLFALTRLNLLCSRGLQFLSIDRSDATEYRLRGRA